MLANVRKEVKKKRRIKSKVGIQLLFGLAENKVKLKVVLSLEWLNGKKKLDAEMTKECWWIERKNDKKEKSSENSITKCMSWLDKKLHDK